MPDGAATAGDQRTAWRVTLVVIAAVAVAVVWPALQVGYFADDYLQVAKLEGQFGPHSPLGLYSFFAEDPAGTAAHIERGSLPWWTVENFRFVHLRPLASLLLELDHWVAPRGAWLHHLHSMVWLVAMLLAAGAVLRRSTSLVIAGLALAAFSVDESLAWTVAWLANRCALVAATFVFGALAVHMQRESNPSPKLWWLELGLWMLALAAGEYAVCGMAYALAYVAVGRADSVSRRARALLPAVLALAGFTVAYLWSDAGVAGGTSYVDPFHQTSQWVSVLAERVSRAAAETWLSLPGETDQLWNRYYDTPIPKLFVLWNQSRRTESLNQAHGRFSLVVLATVVVTLWLLGRRWLTAGERRAVAWTALGSLLSLVPLAATPPVTRTLVLAGLGPAVFMASMVVAAARAWRGEWSSKAARTLGRGLMWLRVGLLTVAALALGVQHTVNDVHWSRKQIERIGGLGAAYDAYVVTPQLSGLPLADKHVVVLAAPDMVSAVYAQWIMAVVGGRSAASWQTLVMGPRRYILRRHGNDALELSAVGETLMRSPHETLFRNPDAMLVKDDTVDAGVFVAKILQQRMWEGPSSLLFTFDRPLTDDSIVLLVSGEAGLTRFELPPAGKSIALPEPTVPHDEALDAPQ